MAKSIVVEGKTSTEAIEKGLKELGLTKDILQVIKSAWLLFIAALYIL